MIGLSLAGLGLVFLGLGFMSDSKIRISSVLDNNLGLKPQIKSLNIYADQIDNNKLFEHLSKTHNAMNKNNSIKNIDLSGLSLENGTLDIRKMTIKSLVSNNFKTNFSIDKNGIEEFKESILALMENTIEYDVKDEYVVINFPDKDSKKKNQSKKKRKNIMQMNLKVILNYQMWMLIMWQKHYLMGKIKYTEMLMAKFNFQQKACKTKR